MTTTDMMTGPYVVGEPGQIVVGLKGTVTEKTGDTITIDGVTVPLKLTADGPVKHLSTQWPIEPGDVIEKLAASNRRVEVADRDLQAVSDDLRAQERENNALLDAVAQLHDENHEGVLTVCLHDVCRRWGR